MNKWAAGLLYLLIFSIGTASAQTNHLSAVIQILGDDVYFKRINTTAEFDLSVGASAPFGSGDQIRTGSNGRVLITLNPENQILLLPHSEFTLLDFETLADDSLHFQGRLRGIAVHDLAASGLDYQLETEGFTITDAIGHFTVWSVVDGLQAVASSNGDVNIVLPDDAEEMITSGMGFAFPYGDDAVPLNLPLHASQVVAQSVGCQGVVVTNGSAGLRLRAGAALDYQVVDILQDDQQVDVVGITENGLWYRIPFQTGFGWIYSSLVDAECSDLQRFPNLAGEIPESIRGASVLELELLEPFYGTPTSNTTFYR